MDWSLREGYAWSEDKEHCEEYGRMLNANPAKVTRASSNVHFCLAYAGMMYIFIFFICNVFCFLDYQIGEQAGKKARVASARYPGCWQPLR